MKVSAAPMWDGQSATRPAHVAVTVADDGIGFDRLFGHGAPSLSLFLWNAHDETIERLGHLDLATEPARLPYVEGKIEHVLLHLRRRTGRLAPSVVDINMARGASTGSTAFRHNAGNGILQGRFHHRHARLGLHNMLGAVVLDKSDPGHGTGGALRLVQSREPGGGRVFAPEGCWREERSGPLAAHAL